MTDSRLIQQIFTRCRDRQLTIGVAESCTGGLLAAALTEFPGSSEVFKGGLVVYDNSLKVTLLGVNPLILQSSGAVSEACVGAMLTGVCRLLNVEAALSVSGIAGPDGGTPDKPVGMVIIGVSVNGKKTLQRFLFHGNRDQIRRQSVDAALGLLLAELESMDV